MTYKSSPPLNMFIVFFPFKLKCDNYQSPEYFVPLQFTQAYNKKKKTGKRLNIYK